MSQSRLEQMAREREEDRKAGRPERGLFTGRGPKSSHAERDRDARRVTGRRHEPDDDAEDYDDDEVEEYRSSRRHFDEEPVSRHRSHRDDEYDDEYDDSNGDEEPRGPRRGAKRTMLQAIRQLPAYVRLLIGLFGDSRVSRLDRFMVLATLAYIVSPLDFIPDIIPFFGQIDDMFLLVLALQRLVSHTNVRVLRTHWSGNPRDLSELNLAGMLSAAGFFLPSQLRRQLTRMANRKGRKR